MQRIELVQDYLRGVAEICRRTKDAEAISFRDHLARSGRICTPLQGGDAYNLVCRPLAELSKNQDTGLQPLTIIPFFEEDAHISPAFKNSAEKTANSRAYYESVGNTIFLRPLTGESEFICGNILLHEAGHAYTAFLENRVGAEQPKEVTLAELSEEGRMYALNARIWKSWGGADYQAILAEAVGRIRKASQGKKEFTKFSFKEQWLQVISSSFGSMLDKVTMHNRCVDFLMFANFEYGRQQGWELHEWQARVVEALYLEDNRMKHPILPVEQPACPAAKRSADSAKVVRSDTKSKRKKKKRNRENRRRNK